MTRFGPYELQGLLGRGGMGEVYRAYDHEQSRTVALKLLPTGLAADESFVERFKQEAYAAAQLNDPHVIPIHRYGQIDGRLYIDMRLVDGVDLAQLLTVHGPLPPGRAVGLVGQAAEALDAAHARQLVHRDVKPSNLLVTAHDFVYLVDFGTAAVRGAGAPARPLTAVGSTIGTLDYMAPEQLLGSSQVDARADVYSLACVLFETLSGQRPFPVQGVPALMHAHLHSPPPRLTALLPHLPAGLDPVLSRGMAKDPDERQSTTGELAADAARAISPGSPGRAPLTLPAQRAPVTTAPAPAPTHVPTQDSRAASAPPTHVPLPSAPPGPPRVPSQPSAKRSRGVGGWLVAAVSLVLMAVLVGVILGRSGATENPSDPSPQPDAGAGETAEPPPSTTTEDTTSTDDPTPPPAVPVTGTPTAPGDLGLATPITSPPCDSTWVVFLGSAVDPSTYASEVAGLLASHPGASYLLTEGSCSSLRQRLDGDLVYAVYLGPFPSQDAACAARNRVGGDSYVKRLDTTTPADQLWSC